MVTTQDPLYPNWDQNVAAIDRDYQSEDPEVVKRDLVEAAAAMADALDSLGESEWERPGRRSDGARFTVNTFSRYYAHDPIHHLWDVSGAHFPRPPAGRVGGSDDRR